jgi:2-polyprenyl-6-hydroxyphenyl methylase/3-demethylubiquinone-9 3-methyltransferase
MNMNIDKFIDYFGDSTDVEYLTLHYSRFCVTKELAYEQWKWERADILDVGAHWLHQSVLYALDGHQVTAADFSNPLDDPAVRRIASNHNINLLVYEDLSSERVFDELDDDSMDVILFCEILEHITFNPVDMWKAIYRVLRPGGRIIITTPNYYFPKSIFLSIPGFLSGWGSGISVSDILHKRTYAPHWKEFSKKELRSYFELLSADFAVQNQRYFSYRNGVQQLLNWKGNLAYDKKNLIPLFRKGIYFAVDLTRKSSGIIINPNW